MNPEVIAANKAKGPMTRLAAFIDFFGLKPGQARMDFAKGEFKALTEEDRSEMLAGLEANGYVIQAGQ